ncbi:MAG: DUF349 domain-containing protein [Cyclobacteriaceae bacterium]
MENVEKVQDVSAESAETPEVVQHEAESEVKETREPDESSDFESGSAPAQEISQNEESEIPENHEVESDTSKADVPEMQDAELSLTEETVKEDQSEVVSGTDNEQVNEVQSNELESSDVQEAANDSSENDMAELQSSEPAKEEDLPGAQAETPSNPKETDANVPEKAEAKEETAKDADSSESDENNEEEEEDFDFSNTDKAELLTRIREVSKEERIRRVDKVIKALKPRFDELYEAEKETALKKFESEGNDPEAFEYHGDEADKEFSAIYSDLRSKRNRFYKDLESQKEDNLKKKEHLLEQLREIVDGEESSSSMNSVKEIQSEWKKTGPVPGAQNKTLWANYNALLDRFYDQRSIYFELKDLDRKKNLKIKEEICERAEALAAQEDLKTAIVQLNELHEEYKHAGSVPREDQEAMWQRFKAASDTIYSKRKDYFDNLKVEFEANYEKKLMLANEAETFVQFDSDSISEWNKKTKEIQSLQKRWEEIGGLPRDKAKAINKQFWGSFKKFFAAKNQFFKRLESTRDDNLKRKEELITQAEEIKESTDWNSTTQKYKDLQAQWKEIGPVPEKVRNEVYKRFKSACDHFFNKRRDQDSEQEKGYEENLKLKLQICDQIEAIAEQDEINLDDVYDLVDNHAQLGFVPRNAIKKDRARFDEVTKKILNLEDLQDRDRSDLQNHIHQSRARSSPGGEKQAQRQEHSIRRKISELENDISTWNTNMEFFAASETADKLKAELQTRINEAKGELENLKSQLSSISS